MVVRTILYKGVPYFIDIPHNISDELADSLTQSITDYVDAESKLYELEPTLKELEEGKRVMESYLDSHQGMRPEIRAQVENGYSGLLSRLETVGAEYDAAKEKKEIAEEGISIFSELCGFKRKPSLREKFENGIGTAYRTLRNILW